MASISGNERPDLRDLLAFYAAAGVDDALVDDPIDRFAESAQRQAAPAQQATQPSEREASRPGADPRAIVGFSFLVTDYTPRWRFYLVQDPRIPSS